MTFAALAKALKRAQHSRLAPGPSEPISTWPQLQRIIDKSPCGDLTFLVNNYGKPFTAKGFGNRMKKWCLDAGLQECSSHGLRKVGAAIAAENGATDHQLMAIYGWKSISEAQRYTKKARQERLAGSGMHLLRRQKGKRK